jgi:hypothetical protein
VRVQRGRRLEELQSRLGFMLRLQEIVSEPVLIVRISGLQPDGHSQACKIKVPGKVVGKEFSGYESDVNRRQHQACSQEDDLAGWTGKRNFEASVFVRARNRPMFPHATLRRRL